MLNGQEIAVVENEAARRGVEPAALMAVVEVESGGRIFAEIGGRREPLIRFEGHFFDRLCPPGLRTKARKLGLASPRAGAIANPPTQGARWALLERAAEIDRAAAWQSTSWGIGQVMGEHWCWLGYGSVEELVREARSGFAGQLRLMLRYIEKVGLAAALAARDWHGFARAYNGPAYRRLGYHDRLAAAWRRHGGGDETLATGDRGEAVKALQELLVRAGAKIAADGIFGPETRRAVLAFQRDHGLAEDGIAELRTVAALKRATAPPPPETPRAGMDMGAAKS